MTEKLRITLLYKKPVRKLLVKLIQGQQEQQLQPRRSSSNVNIFPLRLLCKCQPREGNGLCVWPMGGKGVSEVGGGCQATTAPQDNCSWCQTSPNPQNQIATLLLVCFPFPIFFSLSLSNSLSFFLFLSCPLFSPLYLSLTFCVLSLL